jgi:CNT family concentrative nucleoside transporter
VERLASLFGFFVFLAVGWALSEDRRRIPWRIVGVATLLQLYLALFLVRTDWVRVMLPAAAAACAAVAARDAIAPGAGFAPAVARGLGYLGLLTLAVWALLVPGAAWLGGAVFAIALAAGLATRGRPAAARAARAGAAIAGSLACAALVLARAIPDDFVFRAVGALGAAVERTSDFAGHGARQVFGGLLEAGGFVFAIEVGAILLLFSALMALLYYVGFLPWLVGIFARLFHQTLRVSGAESLVTAANIFLGQSEAPLVVRPLLPRLTRSETATLMTAGFATIAGTVLGVYSRTLSRAGLERGAADLIAASLMSAPAALVFSKLLVPERETPETMGGARLPEDRLGTSALDALAGGVTAGIRLAVNIVAMLLVFYALIEMLNAAVDFAARAAGAKGVTFQSLYAAAFAPFAWLTGVPADECGAVGRLLGTKTIFNEFVAYEELAGMLREGRLSERSAVLSTYSLCGFANLMSIGVQIGGLTSLCPERRPLFVALAPRAMAGGWLACQMTACIVGVIGRF